MNDVPKCWRKKNRTKQSAKKESCDESEIACFFLFPFLRFLSKFIPLEYELRSAFVVFDCSILVRWFTMLSFFVASLPACNVAFNCCRIFFLLARSLGYLSVPFFFLLFHVRFVFFSFLFIRMCFLFISDFRTTALPSIIKSFLFWWSIFISDFTT